MKIDLHHVLIHPISFHGKVEIPSSYYKGTEILNMPLIDVEFEIKRNSSQDDLLFLKAEGHFDITDSKTLQSVAYPFCFEFEEKIDESNDFFAKKLENSKNTLDIMEILWENIVLEIPISYSVSEETFLEGSHDGWEVTKEGEKKSEVDPRLAPLLGLLDKEKE